ncbi:hypothetical protein WA1_01490 [Scytonema hofmannii PCC 7110]|uniref:Uncharacterized protein n=1 Tax=Scytonema hofmannii PCC 7110 TaxID=128403 RepID=A0A139XGN3_9CYAN|nr:hypothetical protein [Scytonema hofmannii]KYC43854.1 hypothetical protein WA1_01490 [Scytonema hofmannii PCC 7110]
MKQWLFTILLPLVLLQNSALAQTPPLSTSDNKQLTLLPLEGTKQIQLNLVNCRGWLDCALSRVFLPASAYIDSRELQFDNRTPRDVTVLNPTVVAQGEITGYQLNTSATVISPNSQILPANQIVGINLLLKRSAIPPDRYIGAVYLNFDTGNRLALPLDLNVRSGPLIPLLVLLLGVILGRLMQYVEKSGGAQAEALKEVNRLDLDIADADLENQDDRKILTNMSKEVRKLVFRDKIDGAMSQIEAIRNRLEVLLNLQLMEQRIGEESLDLKTEQLVRSQIEKIRFFIAQQDDISANELLENLKICFENIGTRSAGHSEMSRSIDNAQAATDRLVKIESIPFIKPTIADRLQKFFVTLSGLSDQVRAEATLWFIKPLLSLTLLLTLTGVGLNSLYIENGKTFGARPFTDFLGLILWGLSADVASRSLSKMKDKV